MLIDWIISLRRFALPLTILLVLAGLYLSSLYNYLLFHSLAEIISVIVAASIFVIFWNSRQFLNNGYFILIGVAFLFAGGLDMVHALAYSGMGVFQGFGSNLPTQLWIAARYMQSLSLLAAPFFFKLKPNSFLILSSYLLVSVVLGISILIWQNFPVCYVDGIGPTAFKNISEIIIGLIFLGSFLVLYDNRRELDRGIFNLLGIATLLILGSELTFTFFSGPDGWLNLVGHFLKLIAYFFFYRALLNIGLRNPIKFLSQSLKLTEERFRVISENSVDVIWIYDMGFSRFTYISPSVQKLFGYSTEEVLNSPIEKYVTPMSYNLLFSQFAARIAAFRAGDESLRVSYHNIDHVHKSGLIVQSEAVTTLLTDDQGDLTQILGISRNISERSRIEEALKASEKKYRELVESMQEGIWVFDKDYNTTFVNSRMAGMLQYSVDEMIGKPLFSFMETGSARVVQDYFERHNQDYKAKPELQFLRKPGDRIYANLDIIPFRDPEGKYLGASAVIEDITERKRMEEELKEAGERYRTVVDNMQGGVILFARGKTIYVNKQASDILGYSQDELLAMGPMDFPAPEDKELLLRTMRASQNTGAISTDISCWIVRKNGERRYIHARYSRMGQAGDTMRFFLVINDLTELKLTEMKLQELYKDELELRHKLEKEINKRIDFTRALVHELKTPLTPVLTSGEMLLRVVKEGMPLRLAMNIYRGANDLNNRVDELLELARMEVGTFKINIHPTDILKLLQEVVSEFKPLTARSKHPLQAQLPESLPVIMADSDRLKQVLMNLLKNAENYTLAGTEIAVSAREEGDNLIIEVKDKGPGISEEMQKRIFEPYFRIENDREKLNGLGLGLGLPIARNLIEMHSGRIWVKSQVGSGTTFGFSLPMVRTFEVRGKAGEKNESLDS
jgi:PAS domain S-box-containing protein